MKRKNQIITLRLKSKDYAEYLAKDLNLNVTYDSVRKKYVCKKVVWSYCTRMEWTIPLVSVILGLDRVIYLIERSMKND